MTIFDLSELWLKNYKLNIKPSTYEHYCYVVRTIIQPQLGLVSAKKITQQDLDRFFLDLQTIPRTYTGRLLCNGLIGKAFMLTKSIIEYGQKINQCKKMIPQFLSVKNPQEEILKVKIFEEDQSSCIIANCLRLLNTEKRFYTLGILFGLFQGLRIGEICGLRWEDIDFVHHRITINRTVRLSINPDSKKEEFLIGSPKSKSSQRTIPINDFLYQQLIQLKQSNNFTGYIIRTPKNNNIPSIENPCSPRLLRNFYTKLLKDQKLPKLNFHCLRHTFASTAIQHNIDPKTVSELLGHSDVKITLNLYVHPSEEQKRKCVNIFETRCPI